MKKLIFLFGLLFFSLGLFATHIVGGSLTYTQANDSTYTITLKLYRDCSAGSVAYPATVNISVMLNNGTSYSTVTIPLGTVSAIPPIIPTCIATSPICMQEGIYSKTVSNLYPTTGGYHLFYQVCCRNASIVNIMTPLIQGDTWYVHIPGTSSVTSDNSPQWAYAPPLFVCQGNNMAVAQGATDADGDSLSYSLYTPYSDQAVTFPSSVFTTASVPWSSTYGANNPLDASVPNSLTIDTNGILHGVPPTIGTFIAGIKCEEWRAGMKIGEIIRDFQFGVINCPPPPVASFSTSHSCTDSVVIFNNTTTPTATAYFWDFGNTSTLADTSNTSNPVYIYSSPGIYSVMLISSPGTACADTAIQIVQRTFSNPSIQGTASYSGGAINSGYAKLFSYGVGATMPMIDSVALVSGNYTFSNILPGNYIVWIHPDTLTYPLVMPTYYNTVYQWDSATVISLACGDSVIANIPMIEVPALSGSGIITGLVLEGMGFVHAPGTPIQGTDVGLEHDPGGALVTHTTTNASGAYSFSNISPGCYTIYVDLPGLPMDSTYHICIAATDTITNLNFYADSNHVYIVDSVNSSIKTNAEAKWNLQVYPNPYTEFANIEFTLAQPGDVKMEMYTVLGEKISTIFNEKKSGGTYKYEFNSDLQPGIYFLKLRVDNESVIKKIIKSR